MGYEKKQILVLFDDGKQASRRTGTCTRDNDVEIAVLERDGKEHLIPKHRIIRIEVFLQ